MIDWIPLEDIAQLERISTLSLQKPQLIFKHSTRCSISVMAKSRLEREAQPADVDFHYLDLLNHRDISSAIAEKFQVHHESPQVLLIKNGVCVYDESHNAIQMSEITEQV